MKLLAALGLAITLLAVAAPNAAADPYYVYNQWGGDWHDANKVFDNKDSNLCWAAAASNILDWADWGTGALTAESTIFNYFKGYWTNQGSVPIYGWQWWFNGINQVQSPYYANLGWAQLTAFDGGKFWPTVNINSVVHDSQTGNLMATMDSYLRSGYGVTLGIYRPGGGHALTAWGFDYTSTYTSVYVTDSDDGKNALRNYAVSWNATNQWWDLGVSQDGLGGSFAGWHLGDVEALDRNVALYSGSAVPIPTSLLLLGSGLLGLVGWRRKFCNN